MTKLEELKAAYAAATPGEPIQVDVWKGDDHNGATVFYGVPDDDGDLPYEQVLLEQDFDNLYDNSPSLIEFFALAHNLMPTLLEAVLELNRFIEYLDMASGDGAYEGEIQRAIELLEKLK